MSDSTSASRTGLLLPVTSLLAALGSLVLTAPTAGQEAITDVKATSTIGGDDDWIIQRVGGDLDAQVEGENGDYRFGRSRVDTALPEGYPAPTPPGAIDLKRYPSVRRAEVTGTMNADWGMNIGFWPLFQHIKKNEIAMTAPVEMDYRDWQPEDGEKRPASWTMSFLYRTADLGPTGTDGRVRVIDTEPLTVISIGLRGPYRLNAIEAGLERLQEWLAGQDEWEAAGDPRSFYYNDPSVPNDRKWAEAQIPVRKRAADLEACIDTGSAAKIVKSGESDH